MLNAQHPIPNFAADRQKINRIKMTGVDVISTFAHSRRQFKNSNLGSNRVTRALIFLRLLPEFTRVSDGEKLISRAQRERVLASALSRREENLLIILHNQGAWERSLDRRLCYECKVKLTNAPAARRQDSLLFFFCLMDAHLPPRQNERCCCVCDFPRSQLQLKCMKQATYIVIKRAR